jgi:hypothetical protein
LDLVFVVLDVLESTPVPTKLSPASLFLLYSRTFPVIAQAEVKTILKSSGDNYKKLRDKK